MEAAKSLVEESRHAIDVVARETGFADSERMRRAFHRISGQPPKTVRQTVRTLGRTPDPLPDYAVASKSSSLATARSQAATKSND